MLCWSAKGSFLRSFGAVVKAELARPELASDDRSWVAAE